MRPPLPELFVVLALAAAIPGRAADLGMATMVDGGTRVLRGTAWHALVAGTVVESGDILEADERAEIHFELASGTRASLVGPGAIYLEPPAAKTPGPATGPLPITVQRGWLKLVAAPPGVRLRTPVADATIDDGIVVLRSKGPALDLFVESGSGMLTERPPAGKPGQTRELKSGDFWSKLPGAAFAVADRPPRPYVEAMPRHYLDALPRLQDKVKPRPVSGTGREISYAEAQPWLAGSDRAVFERRFIGRLRDRSFRNDAAADLDRYPSWDRRLNPRKYAPKPAPGTASSR